MPIFFLSSGQAAGAILVNSLLGKFYLTAGFRLPLIGASKTKQTEILEGNNFKVAHTAQLNEAEWSPLFVGVLLYFHSQNIALPVASSLAAFGSIWFLWAKIFAPFPSHVPGAVMRYASLSLLCYEFCQRVF
jgi:hypothetical protein